MKGRYLATGLAAVFSAALVVHVPRGVDRLRASRALRTTEVISTRVVREGRDPAGLLQQNLAILRSAVELDPAEVATLQSIGSHYLLLARGQAAVEWYRKALDLEPRPALYINLGRALLLENRRSEAMEQLKLAVQLDPTLRVEARTLGYLAPSFQEGGNSR